MRNSYAYKKLLRLEAIGVELLNHVTDLWIRISSVCLFCLVYSSDSIDLWIWLIWTKSNFYILMLNIFNVGYFVSFFNVVDFADFTYFSLTSPISLTSLSFISKDNSINCVYRFLSMLNHTLSLFSNFQPFLELIWKGVGP